MRAAVSPLLLLAFAVVGVSALDPVPAAQLVAQAIATPLPCPAGDCPEPAVPARLGWTPLPDGTPNPGVALLDGLQGVPLETVPLAPAPGLASSAGDLSLHRNEAVSGSA